MESNQPDHAVLDALYGTPATATAAALDATLKFLRARREYLTVLITMLELEMQRPGDRTAGQHDQR